MFRFLRKNVLYLCFIFLCFIFLELPYELINLLLGLIQASNALADPQEVEEQSLAEPRDRHGVVLARVEVGA